MNFEDILYEKKDGIAIVTINRPKVYNAFRGKTVDEMILAFKDAWHDPTIGVVVLTGAGDKAFCTGGDQKDRGEKGYGDAKTGIGLDMETLHWIIRAIPKPVIAAVNGYAIGGGHVLHVICDLTIAADTAKFGQVGPKVGSFDAGYGTAYLARVVGEKKAREIWYLCRQYTAQEAIEMGLVNKVVPADKLMDEVFSWCREILAKSSTSIKFLKHSFNSDTDHIEGISRMSESALALYVQSEEAQEGLKAFKEKRPPDFSKFRK
ncbi:MAG: 1,4-dihydroxy-2-naphthoyl-CoA synthase [Nitrospirae bacterium]|nr:1,4-dihydroxy-2-naphthoyl-CoA synthase [Nitrospirota bacterium]